MTVLPVLAASGLIARRRSVRGPLIGGGVAAGVLLLIVVAGVGGGVIAVVSQACQGGGSGGAPVAVGPITPTARREIPTRKTSESVVTLQTLVRAGEKQDIDWHFVASIAKQECDFGRCPGVDQVNYAGCVGPMQLGVGGACGDFFGRNKTDGDGDGRIDPLDAEDAVATAITGVKGEKGAPGRGGSYGQYRKAACGYYGACADGLVNYADEVMARAVAYGFRGPGAPATGDRVLVNANAAGVQPPSVSGGDPGTASYPLARDAKVLGGPDEHASRSLGNWQSDHAVDLGVPAGTQVLAVEDGQITRTGGAPPTRGGGVVGGYSITLVGGGDEFFYTHMETVDVRPGDRVRAGQVIGTSGYANGVDHLHIAARVGDPMALWGTANAGQPIAANADCGGGTTVSTGPADLQKATIVRQPRQFKTLPAKYMNAGRSPQPVDSRIYPNVIWVLETYDLAVNAAREPGHNTHGDGTAIDAVPAKGGSQAEWDRTALKAAQALGWRWSCGGSGGRPACPLVPAIHWIGYEGYPNHGSPKTCSGGCPAHIHISWESDTYGTGAPGPPPGWVKVFPSPGIDDAPEDTTLAATGATRAA